MQGHAEYFLRTLLGMIQSSLPIVTYFLLTIAPSLVLEDETKS